VNHFDGMSGFEKKVLRATEFNLKGVLREPPSVEKFAELYSCGHIGLLIGSRHGIFPWALAVFGLSAFLLVNRSKGDSGTQIFALYFHMPDRNISG